MKKLWYKFLLWRTKRKFVELDIDMTSCIIYYEEYFKLHEEIEQEVSCIQEKLGNI